jgi:signal transduction histidine kinase
MLSEILQWYIERDLHVPGLDEWIPEQTDAAAWALLSALHRLTSRVDEHHVLDFMSALHHMIGVTASPDGAEAIGDGVLTRLRLPADPRLPAIPFLDDDGLAAWVADRHTPPPERVAGPLVWFILETHWQGSAQPGIAHIDGSLLFRLVAPSPGDGMPWRRAVNLLRAVSTRLPIVDVLGDAWHLYGSYGRDTLAWLLDVAGVRVDSVALDVLWHYTGGHTALVHAMLHQTVGDQPPIGPRAERVDAERFTAVRHNKEWRTTALAALLDPYRQDPTTEALLWTAIAFYEDDPEATFTLSDLKSGIVTIADEDAAAALNAESEFVRAAAERLTQEQIFVSTTQGFWALARNGLPELLSEGHQGRTPKQLAEQAVDDFYEGYIARNAALLYKLSERIIRTISHSIDSHLSGIRTELSLVEEAIEKPTASIDRIRRYADAAADPYSMFRRAMHPARRCDLHTLLVGQANQIDVLSGGVVRAQVDGDSEAHVQANEWLLSQAFFNLFDNARRAAEKTGREFGRVRIQLVVTDGKCVVEIEDSGSGLPDEQRHKLNEGERVSSRTGGGAGIPTARSWITYYKGTLTFVGRSADLDGEHVRVQLPLAPPEDLPKD